MKIERKKERKKKGMKSRVASGIPLAKMGWFGHPIFGQGVVGAPHFGQGDCQSHPHGLFGGGRTTPMPKGVVRPPPKGQKKKKRKMCIKLLGVAEPPPKAQNLF
jgi:hypothetical protein